MSDGKSRKKSERMRLSIESHWPGSDATIHEIQEVMADEGYSASQRKGWLKTVLTELEQTTTTSRSAEMHELIEQVKDIMDHHQDGEPVVKDGL